MRIVLATAGSLGDLHPFLALGQALKARGVAAEVATSADYRGEVLAAGLVHRQVGPDLARMCRDFGMDKAQLTHEIAASEAFLIEKVFARYMPEATRQLIAVGQDASAIVAGTFSPGGQVAAEYLGLPFVSVALQPSVVFSAYDPPVLQRLPWLKPASGGPRLLLNRAVAALARRATSRWMGPVRELRKSLGMPATHESLFLIPGHRVRLCLGLYSPLLSPRQPDAPANFDVIGYAPYDRGQAPLPPALARFLAEGPAPVVFTLGSAAVNIPGRFYSEGAAAAKALGLRAVLLVGPEGDLSVTGGATDMIALPYAPYAQLFPQAAAIVHQGGVGTTQQALRAGKPQVIVPHLGDQFDNGARVARSGAGATISREAYEAPIVALTLEGLLSREAVLSTAAALGERARQEDGASAAADRIIATLGA